MNSISHYPHDLNTKFYAVSLYRNGNPISFVCRRHKCSKASLMRWNKKFGGTKDSLIDKCHRPLSPHPNAHTKEELTWIKNYKEEILIYLFVNYMVNLEPKRVILDMLALYLELLENLNLM